MLRNKTITLFLLLFRLNLISAQRKANKLLDRGKAIQIAAGLTGWSSDPRIVGGTEAKPNEFPWMVDIRAKGQHACGGSILNPYFVITAAHCVYEINMNLYEVVAGDHNIRCQEGREQKRLVVDIRVHPGYSKTGAAGDDLAILQVDRPFVFNEFVNNVFLVAKERQITETAVVAGWGWLQFTDPDYPDVTLSPDKLRKVTVPRRNNSDCQKAYAYRGFNNRTTTCWGRGGKAGCKADSGGPVMCGRNRELCGIHSGAKQCAVQEFPAKAPKIPAYLKWIGENSDVNQPPPPVNITKCGGLSKRPNISIILENLEPGMRCFWSLDNPYYHKSFTLIKTTLLKEDEIWVSRAQDLCVDCSAERANFKAGTNFFYINARIILITLRVSTTPSDIPRNLQIDLISSGPRTMSDADIYFYDMRKEKTEFKFPKGEAATYHWGVTMLGVIAPSDSVGKVVTLNFDWIDIASDSDDETLCTDYLVVMHFDKTGVYRVAALQCRKEPKLKRIRFDTGFLVLLFQSAKDSSLGAGFQISYGT